MSGRARRPYGRYTAAEALQHGRRLVTEEGCRRGLYSFSARFFSRLQEVGLDAGDEASIQRAVQALIGEAKAENFQPMREAFEKDPGYGFEFDSEHLGCRVYFKFRLSGRRPRLEVCSLHTPDRLMWKRGASWS